MDKPAFRFCENYVHQLGRKILKIDDSVQAYHYLTFYHRKYTLSMPPIHEDTTSMSHAQVFEGFILHSSPSLGKTAPRLFLIGRLTDGRTFAVVEEREKPGFYLRSSDLDSAMEELKKSGGGWYQSPYRTIDGEECVRVCLESVKQCQGSAQRLLERGIRTYEADLPFQDQFLISKCIHGSAIIKGIPKRGRKVDLIFVNPEISPSDWNPSLSILSLDIETDPAGKQIYAISLICDDPWFDQRSRTAKSRSKESHDMPGEHTGGKQAEGPLKPHRRQELLFCGQIDPSDSLTPFPDERSLLEGFCERIVFWDPDIITGWNVIDFDLKIIAAKLEFYKIPFLIGRSETPAVFFPGERGRSNTVIIPGRQVLDAVRVVRASPERFSDYRLQTVASSVLGRGKDIELLVNEHRRDAVERLYHQDPPALCRYCLEDARLVLDILKTTGLLDLTIMRCLLIGISMDRAWTSIHSFEYLYIETMHRRGIVAPTTGVDPFPGATAPGGAILESKAGLYDNVWVFDFRSLYPSIIRTFNIDPLSFVPQSVAQEMAPEERERLLRAPNGAFFRRSDAILPELLERFFQSRDEARKAGDQVATYVYKIIMNSFYGVLGAAGSRFASGFISGAITSFGQLVLHWCSDYFTRMGYRVLYGDTDSLFVLSGMEQGVSPQVLSEQSRSLCAQINTDLGRFIEESYTVSSYLELEFEKIYFKLFLPPVRTAPPVRGSAPVHGAPLVQRASTTEAVGSRGRAKGYAGLLVPPSHFSASMHTEQRKEWIEVVGMEAVRRDWTDLARGFQIGLLELLFLGAEKEAIRDFVRKVVKELHAGRLDSELVYRKALRKPVEAYTRSKPPHVRAAGLLDPEDQLGLIHYRWTVEGPQPEGRTTAPIDYTHYVEKQLKPIARGIAQVLGILPGWLFHDEEQLTLF